MPKTIEIICRQCHTPFVHITKRGQLPKYCSVECRKLWDRAYYNRMQKQHRAKKKQEQERAERARQRQVQHVQKYEQKRQAHHLHLKFYNDDESERQIIAFFEQQKANKNLKAFIKELVLTHLKELK